LASEAAVASTTFDAMLNAFWLRPETALWREIDIRAMRPFTVRSPSLDLGCGDGIFSFIRAGGRFEESFDAFRAMAHLDEFFDNADVFDAFDESLHPAVARRPEYTFDVAFDHKENLLRKAGTLGLYRELKVGDANARLPFEDDRFNSLFSNIVYWLDDPGAAIAEIGRILKPGGEACLMLPNRTLPDFSFYNQLYVKSGDPRWAFLEKLDRGRFGDNIRQARSSTEWEAMVAAAGLRVSHHAAHLSKTTIQLWDIGLRPLFPVLRRMTDLVPSHELAAIKREWVATLRQFLQPIADMDDRLGQGAEPAFHCYILTK
jgi:SAM-dependent methyltransferase